MAHFRDICCHLGHTESSGTCAGRRRHIRRAGKWSGLLPTPGASRHRPFGRFVTSSSGMRMLHQHHVGVSAWVSATGYPLSFAGSSDLSMGDGRIAAGVLIKG